MGAVPLGDEADHPARCRRPDVHGHRRSDPSARDLKGTLRIHLRYGVPKSVDLRRWELSRVKYQGSQSAAQSSQQDTGGQRRHRHPGVEADHHHALIKMLFEVFAIATARPGCEQQ
jgi:hypothetical protein